MNYHIFLIINVSNYIMNKFSYILFRYLSIRKRPLRSIHTLVWSLFLLSSLEDVTQKLFFIQFLSKAHLEGFLYHILNIFSYLNKYQENMSITQKTEFYLNYYDLDKSDLDMDIGNMDFFFEKIIGAFKYICNNIYKPILDFNNNIVNVHIGYPLYLLKIPKSDLFVVKLV